MATQTLTHIDTATGLTLNAIPVTESLTNYVANKVALTEGTGDNTGRYVGSVDDTNGFAWAVFSGNTQPADWTLAIGVVTVSANVGSINGTSIVGDGASPRFGV